MTTGKVPMCMRCQWFIVPPPANSPGLPCRAFPDGIPEAIINGNVSHFAPIKGDKGFQYKEISEKAFKERMRKLRKWQEGK